MALVSVSGTWKCRKSRRARVGWMTVPPAFTSRIASMIFSELAPLRRYPEAPALTASSTFSSSSKMVKISTSTAGHFRFTCRVTSMPLIRGNPRSCSSTWGCLFASSSSTASPDNAVPTTWISGDSWRIFTCVLRICG